MKSAFLFLAVLALANLCSTYTPKPQVVYHRADLGEVENKVVVFPTLDFQGKKSKGAEELNLNVMSNWTRVYGQEKVLPAGPFADKLAETNPQFYLKLISSFDNVSAIEQLTQDKNFKAAISKITTQFGNHHLAFSIVQGDSSTYEKGEPVSIHLGLFDTKNLTWKWITKVQDTKGKFSKWDVSSSAMVSNSFDTAQALRQPASQK